MQRFRDQLRNINPITTLGPEQFEEFMKRTELLEFRGGETLYRSGDRDEFAYYLVAGAVERRGGDGRVRPLSADHEDAHYALGNLQPRPHTATIADGGAAIVRAPRDLVESLVARSQMVTGEMPAIRVTDVGGGGDLDPGWMFQIVQSEIFRDLPTENIERFFGGVERVQARAGDEIIRQGQPGDYYYMIVQGECEVLRMAGRHSIPIATLGPGQSFGEEALISGLPRNATVRMHSDGVLMRLAKEKFAELLERPSVRALNAKEVAQVVRGGQARLIDVRLENEHGGRSIRASTNIPLYQLRGRLGELDPELSYVLYCDTGARSSAAAFLLTQHGFDASYLEGGLSAMVR